MRELAALAVQAAWDLVALKIFRSITSLFSGCVAVPRLH